MTTWGSYEASGENSSSRPYRRQRREPTLWVQARARRVKIDSYMNVREVVKKSMRKR